MLDDGIFERAKLVPGERSLRESLHKLPGPPFPGNRDGCTPAGFGIAKASPQSGESKPAHAASLSSRTMRTPWARSPMWLFAISKMNRCFDDMDVALAGREKRQCFTHARGARRPFAESFGAE